MNRPTIYAIAALTTLASAGCLPDAEDLKYTEMVGISSRGSSSSERSHNGPFRLAHMERDDEGAFAEYWPNGAVHPIRVAQGENGAAEGELDSLLLKLQRELGRNLKNHSDVEQTLNEIGRGDREITEDDLIRCRTAAVFADILRTTAGIMGVQVPRKYRDIPESTAYKGPQKKLRGPRYTSNTGRGYC
jgi:hypothetical protein